MKTVLKSIIFCSLLAGGSFSVTAQADSTMQDNLPATPQGQYGTQRVPDQHVDEQKEDRVEVERTALPPDMLSHLNKDSQFEGWDQSPVFYEKNTEQYLVNIVKENSTRTYRFDKQGKPLHSAQPIENTERRQ